MGRRSTTLNNGEAGISREIGSKYDIVKAVADKLDEIESLNSGLATVEQVLPYLADIATAAGLGDQISTLVSSNLANLTLADIQTLVAIDAEIAALSSVDEQIAVLSGYVDELTAISPYVTQVRIVGDDLSNEYSYIEDHGYITDPVANSTGVSAIKTVADNITDVQNAEENAVLAKEYAVEPEDHLGAATGTYSALHYAAKAEDSATSASTSEGNALAYKNSAELSATAASGAQVLAESAKVDAESARDVAVAAKGAAELAETGAVTAQGIAETARDEAVAARDAVLTTEAKLDNISVTQPVDLDVIESDIATLNGKNLAELDVAQEWTANQTFSSVQLSGGTGTQGTVTWNADEETLDVVQNGATLQVGQEVQVHCRNNTGVAIADGTVVMATGTLGASGRITVAPYDNVTDAKYVLGVTTESIPDGDDGKVTTFGKIRGVDTSSWNEGDVLYTDVNGGLTNVEPASGVKMAVAFVVYSAANGTLMVRNSSVNENAYLPYEADNWAGSIDLGGLS